MANETKILHDTITALSTLTNLNSLADGNWWQSEEINDPSPSNEAVRIWWQIVFNATPVAGDYLWFKLARGDGHASEIWDGGIGTSESEISTAAAIAAVDQAPMPQWTHYWATNHGTTFKGSHTVGLHGHSWQLLISARGEALASSGHAIHYEYLTPQAQ